MQNVQQPAAPGTAATGFGDGKLKVFISYSRRDAAFASELLTGLEIAGFEPFLDTHDIAPGEPWEDRLGRLIESADTVVYVISPNSVGSAHCLWEVEKTEALAKRLLPIVWQQVEEGKVPDRLKRLNYVYFDKEHSFAPALAALAQALRTDLGWVREHTRLLQRAQEWEAAGKPENRLLSGKDITDAKAWLAKTGAAQHLKPTELHRDFIQASEQAEALRLSAERQRADQLQESVRRTKRALAAAVVLALFAAVSGAAAAMAWLQAAKSKVELSAKLLELKKSEEAKSEYISQAAKAFHDYGRVKYELVLAKRGIDPAAPLPAIVGPAVSTTDIVGHISQKAADIMVALEVGTREDYERRMGQPTWPGGASGVTIGFGFDLGYYSDEVIKSVWAELPPPVLARLLQARGLKGSRAEAFQPNVADISIPFDTASRVFRTYTLPAYGRKTADAFPRSIDLPPDSFGALVSLVYNRGASMQGSKRDEMRAIKHLILLGEDKAVAEQIRIMKWYWEGGELAGISKRREEEAQLFEAGLAAPATVNPNAPPPTSIPNSNAP